MNLCLFAWEWSELLLLWNQGRKTFPYSTSMLAGQRNGSYRRELQHRVHSIFPRENMILLQKDRSLFIFISDFMSCSWTCGRKCMQGEECDVGNSFKRLTKRKHMYSIKPKVPCPYFTLLLNSVLKNKWNG